MAEKRKHPKSFYDDGLGDILDWIDDEILIHSTDKLGGVKKRNKGAKKAVKLYGDNNIFEPKGEVLKRTQSVKFELDQDDDVKVSKTIEDRTRGLINRLTAQSMPFVTAEFEKLYSTNPRSSINSAMFNNIETSVILEHSVTKRKLVAELMLLASYLSSKISPDIGASLVHRIVNKFDTLYKTADGDEDKRLDNMIGCLVNLYTIGLISAHVIFEVAKRICASDFRPKSVELILILIRNIGFQLRKDNPELMRQLISRAQEKSKQLKKDVGSRIEFMTEALGAIKNNNMGKLGNYGCDIDRDTIEITLKSLIKRSRLPECLSDASYEEIQSSPNWYLLETRVDENENHKTKKAIQEESNISELDSKICRALGLNKPAEKTIFGALLRVSDYIEASNVIIGFGLNHCSDAMLVCIHVAIHEKKYNLFYYNIINNLCKFNRRYKMAAKFAIQDKIRTLGKMKLDRVNIFKVLCFELIKSDAIPVTILKAVEWADLSESTKEFLVYLLENISGMPEEERRKIMSKVDKKSSFAGAMRTFTNCFLKKCKLFK